MSKVSGGKEAQRGRRLKLCEVSHLKQGRGWALQKGAEGNDRVLWRIKKEENDCWSKGSSRESTRRETKRREDNETFHFLLLRLIKPTIKCLPDELYLFTLERKGIITWYTLHIGLKTTVRCFQFTIFTEETQINNQTKSKSIEKSSQLKYTYIYIYIYMYGSILLFILTTKSWHVKDFLLLQIKDQTPLNTFCFSRSSIKN